MYTEAQISELLICSKEIVEPPSPLKEDRGNLKSNFTLRSLNGNFYFYGYIRQNTYFPENFSIGLDYKPNDERVKIPLLRCNGPHGENQYFEHLFTCHIHKATAERINNGLKPDGFIEGTLEYSTIEEAIQFFIKEINLKQEDRERYFPLIHNQEGLF
jgi:hypothetical protein